MFSDDERRAEVASLGRPELVPGRIAQTDRRWVTVWTADAELRASCTSVAKDAVAGDWVAIDPAESRVERILQRRTAFVRRAARGALAPQTLAANIDLVLCVHGLLPGLSERRLERELVLGHQSGAEVAVVLTKLDLVDGDAAVAAAATARRCAPGSPVHVLSSQTGEGVAELRASFPPECTVSLFGSSGVGKSHLVNALAGAEVQLIGEIRSGDGKGRHTTTAARLIRLDDHLMLLDTPGTRALGLWRSDDGLTATFPEILELSGACRFDDCRHTDEPGCAVIAGVPERIDPERLESFRRLRDELDDLDRDLDEQDRRRPS